MAATQQPRGQPDGDAVRKADTGPGHDVLVVVTTVPDRDQAEAIARALVEERLAACVNILAPATSVYRWQGTVETAEEVPLLIKTVRARLEALVGRLRALHPYALPEVIALPVAGGLPDYLQWVRDESSGGAPSAGGEPAP
jgi:periplasmic divalent cation tolerance protein